MKTKSILLIALLITFTMSSFSQVDLKKLKQLKQSSQTENSSDEKSSGGALKKSTGIDIPTGTKSIYVSANTGSNRNDGSKGSPLKDLQKAVDDAPEGAVIHVAEGNYEGKLNAGYISIKKYISIIGGYTSDFSHRDPSVNLTTIIPGAAAGGTNANYGLLDIYVKGNRKGVVLIDGFILDKGEQNCYFLPDPKNPKSGTPEGCESGRLDPPGFQSSGAPKMMDRKSVSNQLIHGDVEGQVTIRNCVLLNGSHFGNSDGQHWRTLRHLQQHLSGKPHGSLRSQEHEQNSRRSHR